MKNKLSSNSKAELKFQKVMHEFGRGKLTSYGNRVMAHKQAVAIAFSEARKVDPEYGMKKDGGSLQDIKQAIKQEIQNFKDKNYYGSEASEKNEQKILKSLEKNFGYNVYDDEVATDYFLKATQEETWQYYLDTIIPKLEKMKKDGGDVYYPFAKKASYEIGDIVMLPDTYGEHTIKDVINRTAVQDGITLYEMTNTFGLYDASQLRPIKLGNGGAVEENLLKELRKLQRDLNSHRLLTYRDGDNSEEEQARQRERASKLARFNEVLRLLNEMDTKMTNGGQAGANLSQIYKAGTAKQLWDAWDEKMRTHFLIDHAGQFFEIMGDDYLKSSKAYTTLTYSTLPEPIRKELVIHHAMGMYEDGGAIEKDLDKQKEKVIRRLLSDESFLTNLSIAQSNRFMDRINAASSKAEIDELIEKAKKLRYKKDGGEIEERINTLKATKATASASAQKTIQAKIDKLQAQLDYNPSAKQRVQDNQGKFALDVPVAYSKAIYKKLWSMNIKPSILKLNGTASIVVNSRNNLNKAYQVYSDISKEKAPSLSRISRKL